MLDPNFRLGNQPRVAARPKARCELNASAHFGGCSSLLSQPVVGSLLRGSGRSQSRHWSLRGPLPPGGSASHRHAGILKNGLSEGDMLRPRKLVPWGKSKTRTFKIPDVAICSRSREPRAPAAVGKPRRAILAELARRGKAPPAPQNLGGAFLAQLSSSSVTPGCR
jgi:hypothetical protein